MAVFSTEEAASYGASWAVRSSSGALRPFSRDKLLLSLYTSCKHRRTALDDASGLTDTVTRKLAGTVQGGVIESQTIITTVQVALNRFDKAASSHYAAFHTR